MKKKHLDNKRGEAHVRTCLCIMLLSMTFVVILNFAMTVAVARSQRKGAMHALESYTQTNAIQIYNNIKLHSDETNSLAPDVYIETLSLAQGLTLDNGVYYAPVRSDGQYHFKLTDIEMAFTVANTTKIHVTYTLQVPLKFLGRIVWIDVPVAISTGLEAKFDLPAETS